MSDHFTDFPFEEIRTGSGDYFRTIAEAQSAGYVETQIWSVVEAEGTWTYGPSHHFVNLLGYVATAEHHDGDTYYHEEEDMDDDEEGDEAISALC